MCGSGLSVNSLIVLQIGMWVLFWILSFTLSLFYGSLDERQLITLDYPAAPRNSDGLQWPSSDLPDWAHPDPVLHFRRLACSSSLSRMQGTDGSMEYMGYRAVQQDRPLLGELAVISPNRRSLSTGEAFKDNQSKSSEELRGTDVLSTTGSDLGLLYRLCCLGVRYHSSMISKTIC